MHPVSLHCSYLCQGRGSQSSNQAFLSKGEFRVIVSNVLTVSVIQVLNDKFEKKYEY